MRHSALIPLLAVVATSLLTLGSPQPVNGSDPWAAVRVIASKTQATSTAPKPEPYDNTKDPLVRAWSDEVETNRRLLDENYRLTQENEKLKHRLPDVLGAAICFGFGLLIASVFWNRKIRQGEVNDPQARQSAETKRTVPPAKKQLIALTASGIWVSVAGLIAANNEKLALHPVNMAFTVAVYSLPAIVFGGVAFWWFGLSQRHSYTPGERADRV